MKALAKWSQEELHIALDPNLLNSMNTVLEDWLEAATWHSGRENIPRRIGDEFTMDEITGDAVTWH